MYTYTALIHTRRTIKNVVNPSTVQASAANPSALYTRAPSIRVEGTVDPCGGHFIPHGYTCRYQNMMKAPRDNNHRTKNSATPRATLLHQTPTKLLHQNQGRLCVVSTVPEQHN